MRCAAASRFRSGADMAPDAFRNPVSTYDQAKAWLFTHSRVEDWLFDPEADLPREALLVCDMFWVSSSDLIRDLRKAWNHALCPPRTIACRPFERRGRSYGV